MDNIKLIAETISLMIALYWSVALIGKYIEFYVKAMNHISVKIELAWYLRTVIFWGFFYYVKMF